MNINVILEVLITLAFLYSLLSVIVSSINEYIIHLMKKRGKFLYKALDEVFNDNLKNKNYTSLLLRNPLIDRLRKDQKSLPAYIGGVQFSEAIIDVLVEEYDVQKYRFSDVQNAEGTYDLIPNAPIVHDAFSKFKLAVGAMNTSDTKKLFNSFLNGTNDYDKLKINIQNWFNDYMDRVNGWYKSEIRKIVFLISVVVTLLFNVNTIIVVQEMSRNKTLREQIVGAAEMYVDAEMSKAKNGTPHAIDSTYKQIISHIKEVNDTLVGLGFPIGWQTFSENYKRRVDKYSSSNIAYNWATSTWACCCYIARNFIGWALTAIALSFGAPFWFDMLSKLVNLRRTGLKPDKKPTV